MAVIAPGNSSAFPTSDLHGWRKCIMPAWSRHCHVGQMGEGRIMQEQLSRATQEAKAEGQGEGCSGCPPTTRKN